jgi:hypothetical protein
MPDGSPRDSTASACARSMSPSLASSMAAGSIHTGVHLIRWVGIGLAQSRFARSAAVIHASWQLLIEMRCQMHE